nr:flocculation protein FLO11-like [Aedes albopictus]
MRRSLPVASSPSPHQQPQQILNYTIASDIQFSSSTSGRNGTGDAMNGSGSSSSNSCSPFLLHSQQQQHQYLSYPLFEGPFQVIEPGSDMYIEMDSDFGLDGSGLFDGSRVMEQQELFISENGIPQEVLEDVFQLDDDMEAAGGLLPQQYPVAAGLSVAEYEKDLVAEMEKLFPSPVVPVVALSQCAPPVSKGSRLMEELVRTDPPELPCYMNVQLKSDDSRKGRKMETAPRDVQRGLRCVELTDGNGTTFKANYFHHQSGEKQTKPAPPPIKNSLQHRRVVELLQSPPLRNLSPAMASKIESLASGNRNVTLTPVRSGSTPPPNPPRPNSTTIVIKTPKRTIGSSGTPMEPAPAPPPPTMGFPFPMAIIKQEPPDDHPAPATIPLENTPIELPVIVPTAMASKQPRKQKLQSLSQCDMVFKEAITPGPSFPSTIASNRRIAQRPTPAPPLPPSRGPPPNDFVTVTIKDVNDTSSDKNVLAQSRPATPRASTSKSSPIPSPSQARPPPANSYPFKKRSLVTHYRVQMTPDRKRITGQPVESIEILDTSEEEQEETNESSTGTATAPESEPEDVPKPKLPGNTESIQCPFCCKVFFASHMLMLHSQNCADAVLFGNSPPKKQPSSRGKKPSKTGESLLKPSSEKGPKPSEEPSQTKPTQTKPRPPPSQPESGTNRKRLSHPRTSMHLSIEILPTAFSIENLLLCEVCKKTFRSQEHLDVHRKIHTTPTVCNFCKKKFHEKPRNHSCQEMKRAKQQWKRENS